MKIRSQSIFMQEVKKKLFLLLFLSVFSASQAQTWNILHPVVRPQDEMNLFDIQFINAQTGFTAGWDNYGTSILQKTANGGASWKIDSVPSSYMFSVNFQDSLHGYLGGYDFGCSCGYIKKTVNGGNSWTDTHLPETFGLYKVIMLDSLNGFACGYDGMIFKTTDGWKTYDSTKTGSTSLVFRVMTFANKDTAYAIGGPNFEIMDTILRSVDGGNTWRRIQGYGNSFSIAGAYFLNGKTGFIAGSNGYDVIMKTTDAGKTWVQKFSTHISTKLISAIYFPNPKTGYAGASDGNIYKSTDSGETWATDNSPATTYINALYMANDSIGYAASENDTVIKRGSVPSGIKVVENANACLSVYPNPASDITYISFSLINPSETGTANLYLYDADGKILRSWNNGISAITNTIDLNTKELPSGVYFVKLQAGNRVVTQKIVVSH